MIAGESLGPTVAGFFVVAAVAVFTAWPLFRRAALHSELTPTGPDAAEARSALYRQILELEFDEQTGKLSKLDGAELRAELFARAKMHLGVERQSMRGIDAEIESEIAEIRQALPGAARFRTRAPSDLPRNE